MGWQFNWVSSFDSDFNYDFHVSFKPEEQSDEPVYYNYSARPFQCEELPGISVFYRDDAGAVFHTYSTYGRGVEVMMGTYNMLDLMPKGRDERDVPHKMEWVRHHDRYPEVVGPAGKQEKAVASTEHCCSGGSHA
jgi:predicted dithiol-disulfide oxidoreductase (DUF899 family)